nr:6484_t:CDS:2 [Entrophospora candida]
MGNDGGSIPKRNELVKEKQKEVRPDQNALTIAIWFFCALSKRPLQEPVVSCALGKLYNKDAIIEYLLNNSAYGDGDTICSHINSLKDVVTLKLTTNLIYKENPNSHSDQGMTSKFVCPITMKEMNGKLKFVYLNTCGCTFSEQGLKEVPSDTCIQIGDGGIASSVTAAVNLKVQEHLVVANTKAKKSKAIQSIYAKKNDDENKVSESYLVRGTFNRYA